MQIINDSKEALPIQRIDATIGGLQEHFYIDGQWCEQRKSMTSTCGNSYFSQNLEPFSLIEFNLADDGMHSGQVEVKYKISIHLRDRIYYSNVIRVYLHENQYQNLVEATHSR